MTTWEDQDRVLLVSWHQYSDSYPEGAEVELQWGEVWTLTEEELRTFIQ